LRGGYSGPMVQETDSLSARERRPAGGLPDLYLCNNYRHLLMSVATIAKAQYPGTVVYLEDMLPMPPDMRARLALACPLATFILTRDADQQQAFARLPTAVPAIIRRNLTLGGRWGMMTPRHWRMPLLAGQMFATGYVYHAGFFTAKVLASRCANVVLREDGLNNYEPLRVPALKAFLRALSGLSPRHQIWGEEPWIDSIEMSHPGKLPAPVRHKARRLMFSDVMDVLPAPLARQIATAFCPEIPVITSAGARTAILLTQPIDDIGICTLAEKQALYGRLVAVLAKAGYAVSIKPHPREVPLTLPGVVTLPPAFPVEAWPYITDQKFSIAVALCSAALIGGARAFAHRTIQLLAPEMFNAGNFADWSALISTAIAAALKDDTGV
jgi:Alpha-2,8-polysialyltransferase (POLYST)